MPNTCDDIWNNCLNIISKEIDSDSYTNIFKPIKPLKLDGQTLTIRVPSQYYHKELENNYSELLHKAITQEIGKDGQLLYNIVMDNGNGKAPPLTVDLVHRKRPKTQHSTSQLRPNKQQDYYNPFNQVVDIQHADRGPRLDPENSFENFLEGDCNRLARSAGLAISEKPGLSSFNPLFIYGGVGLGKTHLVQAIGNKVLENFDGEKFIVYVPTDTFTNQFTGAISSGKIREFVNYYRQVDLLILEDVQFLSGREGTQDLFFQIFNELYQSGKQIVMTSDCAPANMKGVHERLLTRFSQGLTADLQTPDLETRIAIIRQRMLQDGVEIPYDVVEYLAREVDSSIRELEGTYVTLMAHASMGRREINMELVESLVGNIKRSGSKKAELTLDQIRKIVAEHFGLTVEKLVSRNRKGHIVKPRQISMYFIRQHTKHNLKSIARYFNIKDHTTVINSLERAEKLKQDDFFGPAIRELEKKLRNY